MFNFSLCLALSASVLWGAFASSAVLQSYNCSGSSVSGMVQIRLSTPPTASNPYPSYVARSKLNIEGRPVKLSCAGDLSYFKREGMGGSWKYDESVWIFALCGANLPYSDLGEGFHLEVHSSGARGYLGHRDHLQGSEDLSRYDFRCSKI